jgi:hypothetical protein
VIGAVLLIGAWVGYRWEWKKNADELFPKGEGAPEYPTDEELRYEWELHYIVTHKQRREAKADSDDWDET